MRNSKYRLAIRADGNMVCAYFAEIGTMENAKLVGTMARAAADVWPDTFEAFKTAMSVVVVHMVEAAEGQTVASLTERPAPPSERGQGAG